MRAIHRQLGQTVPVVDQLLNGTGARRTMRIVGVAVFPSFSRGGFAATDLGNGAAVPASVLSVRSTPSATTACRTSATCYNFFLIRYKPGTNLAATAAGLTAAVHANGCPPGPVSCSVITDQRPSDIKNYTGIRDTPLVLGAVVALLAVGTLAHVLFTSVHRRRRDLAVLKTLGLSRSQLQRVVAWEASSLAAVALLVGLPLGALAGGHGPCSPGPSESPGKPASRCRSILLAIPAALLLANLIAAPPGWAAARIRPAHVLRSE